MKKIQILILLVVLAFVATQIIVAQEKKVVKKANTECCEDGKGVKKEADCCEDGKGVKKDADCCKDGKDVKKDVKKEVKK